jgi:hypothetical protein
MPGSRSLLLDENGRDLGPFLAAVADWGLVAVQPD